MRLLIVEDEKRLALSLAKGLTAEGFAVDVVHDGPEGLHRALEESTTWWCSTSCCPG